MDIRVLGKGGLPAQYIAHIILLLILKQTLTECVDLTDLRRIKGLKGKEIFDFFLHQLRC